MATEKFDLQKFKDGAKLITRCGVKVKDSKFFDAPSFLKPVVALLEGAVIIHCDWEGRIIDRDTDDNHDLLIYIEPITKYYNLWPDFIKPCFFDTIEECKRTGGPNSSVKPLCIMELVVDGRLVTSQPIYHYT